MHESIKLSTLVASSNFLLVHFGISQCSAPVFLSRKEEGRASCVCCGMQKSKSAFKAGQHRGKNDKSSKTEETLDLWKGKGRIHQPVISLLGQGPSRISLSKRGRSCQLCVLWDGGKKVTFRAGQHVAKMISRQKQKKHSICAKENRRIQQAVLADVRVLGEVASLRCVSCACSFCLNILMRLDMTHTDLSHRHHRPSA